MKPIHPILLALAAILACAPLWAASRAVLLTCGEAPGYTQALADALEGQGISLTPADLGSDLPSLLEPDKNPLLIAVAPGSISAEGLRAVSDYLENGGRLLTIGGPAFTDILYGYDGGWLSREEYLHRAAADVAEGQRETILDASDPSALKEFKRGTNNPDDDVTYTVGDYGLAGSRGQIKGDVPGLKSWENFNYPVSPKMKDANAVAFMAKGDADTKYLYVEMTDRGGSRWYASAALTEEWRQYLLSESDFVWWHDSKPSGRQHPAIGEIATLTMGFAQTGAPIPPGHHVFYLSDVELMKADIQDRESSGLTVPTLCPEDQVFPVTNAAGIETAQNQIFVKDREYILPREVFSCSPKRQGTGIDKGRDFRFIPLLEMYDAKELHCGYAAWMNVFAPNEKGKVSVVGCLSPQSEDFYDQNGIAAAADIARAML
ncbi:MAG: hypothetical protein J5758_05185, partial [Abditibacteriota bacterium]|nr:hypothetical protein [Abditibacteriota bacterium]